jgi:hypothetical protein
MRSNALDGVLFLINEQLSQVIRPVQQCIRHVPMPLLIKATAYDKNP